MNHRALFAAILTGTLFCLCVHAQQPAAPVKNPSVLIVNGGYSPYTKGDFDYFKQLNQHGFQLDTYFNGSKPFNWDLIQKYNCLLFIELPFYDADKGPNELPNRKAMQELLDRYLQAGGGVFIMPDLEGYAGTLQRIKDYDSYLQRWGARIPLDTPCDPATETKHPRCGVKYIYTDKIAPSPVSDGVKGIWFPGTWGDNWAFHSPGMPVEVSNDWTAVVKGSDTSFTQELKEVGASTEHNLVATMFHRPDERTPPTLYAIRQAGEGRVAATVLWPIFNLYGGLSWVHDGVLLSKGLAGRGSDFGKMFENTLRWLSEPSMAGRNLGGYQQDPLVLLHPHFRKKPNEFFSEFESYQNPTPPGNVFRGLIGARTSYSSGKGTVADYAAAAKRSGLNFVVFLEEFGKFSEDKLKKLEEDCRKNSDDQVFLIPGYSIDNNIGNHMFFYGFDNKWPTPSQLDGSKKDQLRTQCKDKDGNLNFSDEDAKNLLWHYTVTGGPSGRNIGYYDFSKNPGMLVRNLRLFGILGVVSYINGKQVEDLTPQYLDYVVDGDPPLACAVDIVSSPQELEAAVKAGHYLTNVTANSLKDLPNVMMYGHQYGRANVNPSNGPQIKAWAGTERVMTFAGEPFITARYRVRPEAWVTSEVGLKEIRIYCDRKLYRRIALNGDKEYKQTFEWSYDRHRIFVLEAIDMKGGRALSAGHEVWCDANFNSWCHDRQNGELWHGPFILPGPRWPLFSQGPTWDGGGSESFIGMSVEQGPGLKVSSKDYVVEGWSRRYGGRWMEGNTYPTCWDDSCANVTGIVENNYAPGVVANAYHTLGPVVPSTYMTYTSQRTQFLHRIAGPNLDTHAMWPERVGGNVAMMEGTATLRKEVALDVFDVAYVAAQNFAKDSPNVPVWAVRTGNDTTPLVGSLNSIFGKGFEIPRGLGRKEQWSLDIQPGGYVGMFATQLGNNSMLFNLGDIPLRFTASPVPALSLPVSDKPYKAGENLGWKYLVVYDSMSQDARNLQRLESIREYFGLDGIHNSGIVVKRGKLLKHFGLVDIAPDNGVAEFEVPVPDFDLDIPLGLRFIGFNPNWTIGELQIEGYSTGYYHNGKNVYRTLATDDRDMVHLAVYTTGVPRTHCIIGHPVQCDAKDLNIAVTRLSDKPEQYYVAVNNPTDRPIKTTLKKGMDLPGFDFPDTSVEVPPGGYTVVREK